MDKTSEKPKSPYIGFRKNTQESPEQDELTGLPNRKVLLSKLQDHIAFCQEHSGKMIALLVLDIDHFKVINNSLGIPAGDKLLVEVAKRLQSIMRADDYVARLGGDEFAFILSKIQGIENIRKIATRIHEVLIPPFYLNDSEVFINTSLGITHSNVSFGKAEDFLRDADTAMNHAKSLGRSCCATFQLEMRNDVVKRLNLGNSLRQALERKEFFLEYQPIVSLREESLIGFEALIRWNHPQRGVIPPSDFIPLAEEFGLVNSIGQWALEEACQQMKDWQTQFESMQNLLISVNLSAKQISHSSFWEQVKGALHKSRLDPHCLKLEITENILLQASEQVLSRLRQAKSRGIKISIDDFGTGYSSLSYLMHFPFDMLKLDASFTADIESDHKKFNLVKGILTLSKGLGIEVIAEGLETQEQLAQFKALGCKYGQGYTFSKPLSDQNAASFILSNLAAKDRLRAIERHSLFSEKLGELYNCSLTQDELLIQMESFKLEIKRLRQDKRDLELILETAESHSEIIESELHKELTDYQTTELALQETNLALQHLSYIDGLTQIANRRHFDEHLCQEWQYAIAQHQPISLIFVDVDYFKLYNDEYGHQAGDACLIQIAQTLSKFAAHSTDLAARYGGEEFALILPAAPISTAVNVAENVRSSIKSLKMPHTRSLVKPYVTVSLGVASVTPQNCHSLGDFVRRADAALYNAKHQGRDCFTLSSWSS